MYLGTAEVLAKLIVLEGEALAPGASAFAQLVLASPVLAVRSDRFVLRDETARRTIGGGEIVNPFAARHRRDEVGLGPRLGALRGGANAAAALALLELTADFGTDRETIGQALDLTGDEVAAALATLPDVVALPDGGAPEAYLAADRWTRFEALALAAVAALHRAEPLAPGLDMESLRARLPWAVHPRVFRWCMERLVALGRLVREESILRAPDHHVALGAEARAVGVRVEQLLEAGALTPPDLRQLAQAAGVGRERLLEVLGVLEGEGRVVRVGPDLYYARAAADRARTLVTEHCRTHGEISAAALRDRMSASRKYAIALLDWCDRTGVTTRIGDLRRLRR